MYRRDTSYPKIIFIVTIPLISLSLTFVLLYLFTPLHRSEPVATVKQVAIIHEAAPVEEVLSPVRLAIPKTSTDAVINPVGVNATGDMDIDDDPTQLAWYKLGPKPGEQGSAVVAGHYGWKDGAPSVFNGIHSLVKGDQITIFDEDGVKKTFIVTRTATYAPNQDATDVFKSDDGKSHLNLITCQGSWIKSDSTYSERLVVFTDYLK